MAKGIEPPTRWPREPAARRAAVAAWWRWFLSQDKPNLVRLAQVDPPRKDSLPFMQEMAGKKEWAPYRPSFAIDERNYPGPSRTEVMKILNMPDATSEIGIRNRALLMLLYDPGSRRDEIATLSVSDYHPGEKALVLEVYKGGTGEATRSVVVPLSEIADARVRAAIAAHPLGEGDAPLWPTTEGNSISGDDVHTMVDETAKAADVQEVWPVKERNRWMFAKKFRPHNIRRAGQRDMYQQLVNNRTRVLEVVKGAGGEGGLRIEALSDDQLRALAGLRVLHRGEQEINILYQQLGLDETQVRAVQRAFAATAGLTEQEMPVGPKTGTIHRGSLAGTFEPRKGPVRTGFVAIRTTHALDPMTGEFHPFLDKQGNPIKRDVRIPVSDLYRYNEWRRSQLQEKIRLRGPARKAAKLAEQRTRTAAKVRIEPVTPAAAEQMTVPDLLELIARRVEQDPSAAPELRQMVAGLSETPEIAPEIMPETMPVAAEPGQGALLPPEPVQPSAVTQPAPQAAGLERGQIVRLKGVGPRKGTIVDRLVDATGRVRYDVATTKGVIPVYEENVIGTRPAFAPAEIPYESPLTDLDRVLMEQTRLGAQARQQQGLEAFAGAEGQRVAAEQEAHRVLSAPTELQTAEEAAIAEDPELATKETRPRRLRGLFSPAFHAATSPRYRASIGPKGTEFARSYKQDLRKQQAALDNWIISKRVEKLTGIAEAGQSTRSLQGALGRIQAIDPEVGVRDPRVIWEAAKNPAWVKSSPIGRLVQLGAKEPPAAFGIGGAVKAAGIVKSTGLAVSKYALPAAVAINVADFALNWDKYEQQANERGGLAWADRLGDGFGLDIMEYNSEKHGYDFHPAGVIPFITGIIGGAVGSAVSPGWGTVGGGFAGYKFGEMLQERLTGQKAKKATQQVQEKTADQAEEDLAFRKGMALWLQRGLQPTVHEVAALGARMADEVGGGLSNYDVSGSYLGSEPLAPHLQSLQSQLGLMSRRMGETQAQAWYNYPPAAAESFLGKAVFPYFGPGGQLYEPQASANVNLTDIEAQLGG